MLSVAPATLTFILERSHSPLSSRSPGQHHRRVLLPSYPVSYEPAEDGGVDPHGLSTVTGFLGPLPRRRHIFQDSREEGESFED